MLPWRVGQKHSCIAVRTKSAHVTRMDLRLPNSVPTPFKYQGVPNNNTLLLLIPKTPTLSSTSASQSQLFSLALQGATDHVTRSFLVHDLANEFSFHELCKPFSHDHKYPAIRVNSYSPPHTNALFETQNQVHPMHDLGGSAPEISLLLASPSSNWFPVDHVCHISQWSRIWYRIPLIKTPPRRNPALQKNGMDKCR